MTTLVASAYYRNAILEATFRGGAYTFPAATYLALFRTDPTINNTGTEVGAGLGYARQAAVFSAESGGEVASSAEIRFGPSLASWGGTIGFFGLMDNATIGAGHLLFFGPVSRVWTIDQDRMGITVPAGDLVLGLQLCLDLVTEIWSRS